MICADLRKGSLVDAWQSYCDAWRDGATIAAAQRALDDESSHAQANADAADMRDLRQLPWVSIDNDDSLDLDQLSASGTDAAGNDVVYVAVADVDALVGKD